MRPMRRVAAAIAVSAFLGTTALPALAVLCCAPAPAHACCAKGGEEKRTALGRAPCCKASVALKTHEREPATPRTPSASVLAVPLVALIPVEPALLAAEIFAPACLASPASPPLGPPLRLRI